MWLGCHSVPAIVIPSWAIQIEHTEGNTSSLPADFLPARRYVHYIRRGFVSAWLKLKLEATPTYDEKKEIFLVFASFSIQIDGVIDSLSHVLILKLRFVCYLTEMFVAIVLPIFISCLLILPLIPFHSFHIFSISLSFFSFLWSGSMTVRLPCLVRPCTMCTASHILVEENKETKGHFHTENLFTRLIWIY